MNKKTDELLKKIDKGVNLAIREALERHKKLGESVVVYEDGEIKTYTGEEIQILLDRDKDKK